MLPDLALTINFNDMKVDWKGVYPAVTTKFLPDGTLDEHLFKLNLQAQLDGGVHAIVLGGTLGEASTLVETEKLQLVSWAQEVCNGHCPVILNIAEQSTVGAIDASRKAEDHGADGLMMLPPMRYKASDDETVAYYKAAARSTSLPIMVYNNPVDYKIEVTLDMFSELAEESNIQAVKESTRDITNITRMRNRFGDRFNILCGVDTLAMESILMGADGWVAGLVCAFPKETVAIYQMCLDGRIKEARDIYRWFMPMLELDIHPKLVQNIKLAEQVVGLGSEHVRAPRLPLAGEERARVLDIINSSVAIRPEVDVVKTQN